MSNMKKITQQKLQAFEVGSMGQRPPSRRAQDEKRKREEEESAEKAFKEFVETFEDTSSSVSKVWVKAGTYDAGSRRENHRDKGKLYKPQSKLEDRVSKSVKPSSSNSKKESSSRKEISSRKGRSTKKESSSNKESSSKIECSSSSSLSKKNPKVQEKKKSNLELFKEELRQIQEERVERRKYKSIAKGLIQAPSVQDATYIHDLDEVSFASMDSGDPNTTNIYMGNLNPNITEQQLTEIFGRFGPLASIKIMWPRSEEEKSRGRNCGFVAYMSRLDAERSLKAMNGRDVMGFEMKLGWGKTVSALTYPIYIPPALIQFNLPPPPSGLPFNAQPQPSDAENLPPPQFFRDYADDPDIRRDMEKLAYKSIVRVMIPTDRPVLWLVHRMVEFVLREGPLFEAMIMSLEIDNPNYRFLFENESPEHIYYRWKLFSLLQGDTPTEWNQKEFRMFEGGPIWKPPPMNFYTQGMPEELIEQQEVPENYRGTLSTTQRDRLEHLIRHMTPERSKIADCMIYCIEHAEAADEICECIAESMSSPATAIGKKIARIYLVSDILHNCTVKVSNASFYRTSMGKYLEDMFNHLHTTYHGLQSRLKAEGFKDRVVRVLKAWTEWLVYDREFIHKLEAIFLGIQKEKQVEPEPVSGSGDEKDDDDLDGVPLDGAALLKSALLRGICGTTSDDSPLSESASIQASSQRSNHFDDDDIDGIPLDGDINGVPLDQNDVNINGGGFIPSKWETVDPDQVEAQAITTTKWDTLEPVVPEPPIISTVSDDSSDSLTSSESIRDLDAEKRIILRDIELETIQYQDELESGQCTLKSGWSMQQQVEHYRHKLMKKTYNEMLDSPISSICRDSRTRTSVKRSVSPLDTTMRAIKSRRSSSPSHPRTMCRKLVSPTKSVRTSKRERLRSRSRLRRRSRSYSRTPKRYRSRTPPTRSSSKRSIGHASRRARHTREISPQSGTARSTGYTSRSVRNTRESSPQSGTARYSTSSSSSLRHRTESHRHMHKY